MQEMIEVTSITKTIYVITDNSTVRVTTIQPSPSQRPIQFQDESVNLGTKGTVETINFTGSGVTASRNGNNISVSVTSGGGSGDVVGPSSAVNNNIVLFDGTTGKLIKDGGSGIPSLSNLSDCIWILSSPTASTAITNQPVAETFFISSNRHTTLFNTSKYTSMRLVVHVTAGSASANTPRLYMKYKTTFATGDTVGTFTTIGTGSGTEACSLTSTGIVATDWITIPAGAVGDVYFCIAEIGGDATADPGVSIVVIQFRV